MVVHHGGVGAVGRNRGETVLKVAGHLGAALLQHRVDVDLGQLLTLGQRLFQIRSRAGRGLPVKAQRAAGEAKGSFELFQRKRHAAAGGEHNDALNVRHPHSVAEVVGGAFQLPGQPPERLGKAQKQAFLFFGRAAPVFAEQVQAFFIGNFIVRNFFGEGG